MRKYRWTHKDEKLVENIVDNVGLDTLEDIARYGASGGYDGFIYTDECCEFYLRHRKAINIMLEDMADDIGEDLFSMIDNFHCFKDDVISKSDIAKVMYNEAIQSYEDLKKEVDHQTIANHLCWFAVEAVASDYVNREYTSNDEE